MSFLTPIWLSALAALGIPVVIHLWNIRPGRTLKVGSISLITEASKSTSRSFKLLDVLLLILRCLLLSLLAVFLAQPVWRYFSPAKQAKGWVMLPYGNFNETYKTFKPRVDSLLSAGYELHFLRKDLAKPDLKKTPITQLGLDAVKDDSLSCWELINKVSASVPRGLPVYVFTPNNARHFRGTKPETRLLLNWQTYTQADSSARFIASAWFSQNGDISITEGNSTTNGVTYATRIIKPGGDQQTEVTLKDGQSFVSLKGADQQVVAVDTSTIRIAIYTGGHQLDAAYLKAALDAAVNFMGRKALVKEYSKADEVPDGQTWLFWLSEQPVGDKLMGSSKNIFKYEVGKVTNVATRLYPGEVKLTKQVTAKQSGEVIWADGFGHPVLDGDAQGQAKIYNFYSRFNPAWGDLVWSDAFPKQVLALITNPSANQRKGLAGPDKRILSNQQLQPNNMLDSYTPSSVEAAAPQDISRYFWLALVLIFLLERILAHKTKPANNG